jgi:F0F1-type ATP synthase membrane subunit c/vacuolar-type H+-ATPase subunit K
VSVAVEDVRQGCRRAQLVGLALVLSLVSYAVVVESLVRTLAPFKGFAPDVPVGTLRVVMAAIAIANLIVGRVLHHKVYAAATVTPTRSAPSLTQRLFTQSVVELGLSEAIAVYGLVLFLIGGQPLDFYAFAALALVSFALSFPRLSQWEEHARQQPRPAL